MRQPLDQVVIPSPHHSAAAPPHQITALVIGNAEPSCRSLLDELRSPRAEEDVVTLAYAEDLEATSLLRIPPPDLAIVLQDWPDQFTASEVAAALARWPLTRWVCCYGPWCASDGRTRRIWPAAVRVPLDEALPRIDHELAVIRGRSAPLAVTASADEVFAFDHDTVF